METVKQGVSVRAERLAFAINAVLVAAIAFEVIFIGYRVYNRWDLTQNESFTVSQRSIRFLESLDEGMRVVVFYGRDYPPHRWTWQRIHDLLEELQLHSRFLEVEYVDPFRNPAQAQQLRQKYSISSNDFNSGAVVFEYGDKSQYIADSQIVEYEIPPGAPAPDPLRDKKTFLGEDAFLGVMTSLVEGIKPLVWVLAGHGEADIQDEGPRGFAGAALALRADGFEVRKLILSGEDRRVPEGAFVAIAGPQSPLPPEEVHALRRYAERGGKILLMTDFVLQEGEAKLMDMNFGPLLDYFGMELGKHLLVDDQNRNNPSMAQFLRVTRYAAGHPATKAMGEGEEKPTVFITVRDVLARAETAVPVVFSPPTTVAKTDISEIRDFDKYRDLLRYGGTLFNPEKDKRGSQPIAVASEIPGKQAEDTGRAVVLGSFSFSVNAGINESPFNRDLLLNLANWLSRRESHMGISPKHPREVSYHVRPEKRRLVFWLVMALMPLIAVTAGVAVGFARRS